MLAGLAMAGFIVFDALDLDGLAEASSAVQRPLVLGTTPMDPATDRGVPPTGAEILILPCPPVTLVGAANLKTCTHVKRVQMVRVWRLPIPRSAPSSAADPL